MHAIELTDLANTYTCLARVQCAVRSPVPRGAAHSYWLNCRYRHDEWSHQLGQHREALQHSGSSRRAERWHQILPVIQEVLLAEPLTRVIAYHASSMEERGVDREFQPLSQSVYSSHLEARHRCLHLIVFGRGLTVEDAVRLNRLRRAMESLTDNLLALFLPVREPAKYFFQTPDTLPQTAPANALGRSAPASAETLLQSHAVREMTSQFLDSRVAQGRLNLRISHAVLQMFSSEVFDGHGRPYSPRMGQILSSSLESTGNSSSTQDNLLSPLELLWGTSRPAAGTSARNRQRWN